MGIDHARFEEVKDYAARIIRHKAWQLVNFAGFKEHEREDLEQELLLDILHRLPKYNPYKSQLTTFVVRLIENKTVSLIKSHQAGVRDRRKEAYSLNEEIEDDDGNQVQRIELIDQEEYFSRTGWGGSGRPQIERMELRIDLKKAIAKLSLKDQHLCERLTRETVKETSQSTGIPRPTIYNDIKRIRKSFQEFGLDEYL